MVVYFVEATSFTTRIVSMGLEAQLRELQDVLRTNPDAGATDAGTGGLRKVRMPDPARNKGKRGGARVHYLHLAAHGVIYLMFVYGKNEQDALSARQKRGLKTIVDAIKAEWDSHA